MSLKHISEELTVLGHADLANAVETISQNEIFNIDKTKKVLGDEVFNHISKANKEVLEKMLSDINKDIDYLKNNAEKNTMNAFLPKRLVEKQFIEYRLQ